MDEHEGSSATPTPDGVDACVVVALCQALGEAHYDRFIGQLSATRTPSQAAAVVRWWADWVAAARRRRRPRPPLPPAAAFAAAGVDESESG
jgi:hypothetical protein